MLTLVTEVLVASTAPVGPVVTGEVTDPRASFSSRMSSFAVRPSEH